MKEFIIKYKFSILLMIVVLIIGIFTALKFQSCKEKVKTTFTVSGYDTVYHKQIDSSLKAINNHYDSVFNRYNEKFEIYDSTLMQSDIRQEVRRQVYNELKKYRNKQSAEELDAELRRRLQNE